MGAGGVRKGTWPRAYIGAEHDEQPRRNLRQAGKEKALSPEYMSMLSTVHNLGTLYYNQGNLPEAETMYRWALVGYEKQFEPEQASTLTTVHNLGNLYRSGEADRGGDHVLTSPSGVRKSARPSRLLTPPDLSNWGHCPYLGYNHWELFSTRSLPLLIVWKG